MEETKLIEILKKKEEELEVLLEEARKKADAIVEDARKKAARIEASYRDEIEGLERRLLKEEERHKREAVERIVGNVLTNAFKHNAGEWVRVKLEKKALVVENPSREIKNPGMLFERYYRESSRGMGVGLSIVKRLSEELGWRVRANFSDGVFRIEITFG